MCPSILDPISQTVKSGIGLFPSLHIPARRTLIETQDKYISVIILYLNKTVKTQPNKMQKVV